MRFLLILGTVVLLVVLYLRSRPRHANVGLPDRDPSLARKLVQQEAALLLDVRSQGEWDQGHLEGATLIPHGEIVARVSEIEKHQGGDKSRPIVVYCRSGMRSGKAKDALVDHGFTRVTNLGAMTNWCDDC